MPDVQEEGSRCRNLWAAYCRDEHHRADCAQELRQETQENDGSEMKFAFVSTLPLGLVFFYVSAAFLILGCFLASLPSVQRRATGNDQRPTKRGQ